MNSFRFRKKTEYGIMMVSLLSKEGRGGLVSVRTMQESGLPRSFLVKIARDLIKAKLIVAKEGSRDIKISADFAIELFHACKV